MLLVCRWRAQVRDVVERRWKVDSLIQKNRFHHVGIVVKSISEAIDKYSAALGLDKDKVVVETGSYVAGNGETEEFKYAFLPLAEGENNFIELVEPITNWSNC